MRTILLAIVPALLLGACSSVEKLNPFSSSDPKVKPAELRPSSRPRS
jgi:uncharacterized protein YceK